MNLMNENVWPNLAGAVATAATGLIAIWLAQRADRMSKRSAEGLFRKILDATDVALGAIVLDLTKPAEAFPHHVVDLEVLIRIGESIALGKLDYEEAEMCFGTVQTLARAKAILETTAFDDEKRAAIQGLRDRLQSGASAWRSRRPKQAVRR